MEGFKYLLLLPKGFYKLLQNPAVIILKPVVKNPDVPHQNFFLIPWGMFNTFLQPKPASYLNIRFHL